MYRWLVFLHVIGIFGFLITHGVSASIFFVLQRERNLDRIRLLLQLSAGASRVMLISLLVLLVGGVAAGFAGQWWGRGWIWVSLVLFFLIYGAMSAMGSRILNNVRQGIGLPSSYGQPPSPTPLSAEQVDALLNRVQPMPLALIGFVGIVILAWLMMFKPF